VKIHLNSPNLLQGTSMWPALSWIWETGKKSPWFHSNNWKHQCYQHSSRTKSKTQSYRMDN